MPEDPNTRPFLKDVLRLVIQIDGMLDDGPFVMDKALTYRQQLYDLIKHMETLPRTPGIVGLLQIAARSFTDLQERLAHSTP